MPEDYNSVTWTVCEPAKTEYRILKAFRDHPDPGVRDLAHKVEILTPGNERLSCMRFSPLEILAGVDRAEHIENILGCFMAAMPMGGPLQALLREALEKVYEDHPDPQRPPTMVDLREAADVVLAAKEYSSDTSSDLRGALDVRIGSLTHGTLGTVFQCRHSVPSLEHLMTVPSIIELARLTNEQACLLLLFLFNGFRELIHASPLPAKKLPGGLRHALFIEEAHNIIGRAGDARPSEDNPDPKAYATEFICRMLAELRAAGVPMIIIDQLPSAVAPQVVKMTGSKLAFRQVANQDREELGGTMLFGPVEMEDIARMQTGEAFFSGEDYFRPRRIRTINLHKQLDLARLLTDEELLGYLQADDWFHRNAAERTTTELGQLQENMDAFDQQRGKTARQIKSLLRVYLRLLEQEPCRLRVRRLISMIQVLQVLKEQLESAYSRFMQGPYRMFSYLLTSRLDHMESDLATWAESLNKRFALTVQSGTRELIAGIDRLIRNCRTLRFKDTYHAKKSGHPNTK